MKRYFFHVRENGNLLEDLEGTLFPSLEAAHALALGSVRKMVSERIFKNVAIDGQTLDICNQYGNVLLTIPFTKIHLLYLT